MNYWKVDILINNNMFFNSPLEKESTGWKLGSSKAILSLMVRRFGCSRGWVGSCLPVQSAQVGKGGRQPHLTVDEREAFLETRWRPCVCNSFRFLKELLISGLVLLTLSQSISSTLLALAPGNEPWYPFTTTLSLNRGGSSPPNTTPPFAVRIWRLTSVCWRIRYSKSEICACSHVHLLATEALSCAHLHDARFDLQRIN